MTESYRLINPWKTGEDGDNKLNDYLNGGWRGCSPPNQLLGPVGNQLWWFRWLPRSLRWLEIQDIKTRHLINLLGVDGWQVPGLLEFLRWGETAGDLERRWTTSGWRTMVARFQVCGFNPQEPAFLTPFSLPRFVPMVGLKVCRRSRGHLTQTIKEQIQLEGKSVRK